jgi:hypothetical protein
VSVLGVLKDMWRSEGSECLFCVLKICGGVSGQSVCFVCVKRYVEE